MCYTHIYCAYYKILTMINIIKHQPDSIIIDIGTFLTDKGISLTSATNPKLLFVVKNNYYDLDENAVLKKTNNNSESSPIIILSDEAVRIDFDCHDFNDGKIDQCHPFLYYYGLGFKEHPSDTCFYEPKFVDDDGVPNNLVIVHRNYVNAKAV